MPRSSRTGYCVACGVLVLACSSDGRTPSGAGGMATGGAPAAGSMASGGTRPASGGSQSEAGVAGSSGSSPASGGGAGFSGSNGGAAGADDAGARGGAAEGGADAGRRTAYYLDVQGRVLALDVDNPTPRTVVRSAGRGPDGIAVDRDNGHIFWTTMGVPADDDGSILRSDLDGSNVSVVVPEAGTYTPKQLKIDLGARKLYWSDREGMRVQRANLDGSNLETLVTVATGATARRDAGNWCVGLALDTVAGFVYWTQKGPDNGMVGSIRRAHVELPPGETADQRSDIEVLFEQLPEPVDLEIDAIGGYLYWTDRGDDTVNRAPIEIPDGKTAATRADREILVSGVREAIGIALDLPRGHVYFTGGTGGRVGRVNLDGTSPMDLVAGTGAFTGIAIVESP